MSERRQHSRTRVLRRAKVVFQRGHSAIDCVVLELSPGGAKLRLGAWLSLPDAFELRLEHGPTLPARVCHRGPESTGVRFLADAA